MALTRGVLGIPMKRFDRPQVGFLSRVQIEAIIAATNASTWAGRRDRVLLATLYNTGARELHGGGPPRLTCVSTEHAEAIYEVEV